MELINKLTDCKNYNRSVWNALRQKVLKPGKLLRVPFTEMDNDTVMHLVMHWMMYHSVRGEKYEIRVNVVERQTVYTATITKRRRGIRMCNIKEQPQLREKSLYCWKKGVRYDNLTYKEIWYSTKRADLLSKLNED